MGNEYQQLAHIPGVGRMWHPLTTFRYENASHPDLQFRGSRAEFIPWAERQLTNPELNVKQREHLQSVLNTCKRMWLE